MSMGNRTNHPLKAGLPILCVDFDGCIHDYRHGWRGGEIYGSVVPGFFAWLESTREYFRVVIYSSRSETQAGIQQMKTWLASQNGGIVPDVEFAHRKPPAFLTIDDRAILFKGSWADLDPRRLREFKPWMQEGGTDGEKLRSSGLSEAGGPGRQAEEPDHPGRPVEET